MVTILLVGVGEWVLLHKRRKEGKEGGGEGGGGEGGEGGGVEEREDLHVHERLREEKW